MFSILGLGYAYADTILDNKFLAELAPELGEQDIFTQTGILERRSCLSLDYLRESRNAVLEQGEKTALVRTTDLAVSAAQMALDRAGITIQDIGLIMAETCTPPQTTPSEAQRVGERFGVKVPAYDVTTSLGTASLYIETLASWKEERIPKYVLCISANTPTQRVDYRSGQERLYFGDGAGAMVVSATVTGKLVLKSVNSSYAGASNYVHFGIYSHMHLEPGMPPIEPQQELAGAKHRCNELLTSGHSKVHVVAGQISGRYVQSFEAMLAQPGVHMLSHIKVRGNILGGAGLCVLAEHWDKFNTSHGVLLIEGIGELASYTCLSVV